MRLKRVITLIFLIPVAVFAILFMVANRFLVTLMLNPFESNDAALSFTAPFFIWLFIFLILGIIVGSVTTWLTQAKYRKALREREDEVTNLRHLSSKSLAER